MIKNLNKINPLKRKIVLKLLAHIDACNKIEKVINKIVIFGSSVRDDCTEESDIDVCITSNYNLRNPNFRKAFNAFLDYNFDIIYFEYAAEDLKETIENFGVCVYE